GSLQQSLLGAHRDRRPEGGIEGLQRGASVAAELRRCPRQPRPRQPEERTDQECDCRFRRGPEDQSETAPLRCLARPRPYSEDVSLGLNWISPMPRPWTRIL